MDEGGRILHDWPDSHPFESRGDDYLAHFTPRFLVRDADSRTWFNGAVFSCTSQNVSVGTKKMDVEVVIPAISLPFDPAWK